MYLGLPTLSLVGAAGLRPSLGGGGPVPPGDPQDAIYSPDGTFYLTSPDGGLYAAQPSA